MTTSIIIPVWNGMPSLPGCLGSVTALQGEEVEIIAIDNGSQDGSGAYIAATFPQVKLICNEQNLGFGAACNQGMALASGDLLVLLNQDTQLAPDWLVEMRKAAEMPDVGIVGCKIYHEDGVTLQHAGAWVEWPLGIVHHYGVGEADTGQWNTLGPVEIVTFAAVAIHRQVVEHVGLFDLGFGLGYYEDVDYCVRARKAGFEILYTPWATLRHQESSSLGKTERIQYLYQQGRLRLLLKHLSLAQFLADFVPAEVISQKLAIRNQADSSALRWAYLAAMTMATDFYAEQETPGQLAALHDALHYLYQVAWAETQIAEEEAPPRLAIPVVAENIAQGSIDTDAPALTLFEFSSTVSIIGPAISWLRRSWYNIAARWGDWHILQQLAQVVGRQRSLIAAQEAQAELNVAQAELNQNLEQAVRSLSKQVAGLTAENGQLARRMAEIKGQLSQSGPVQREKLVPYVWDHRGKDHDDES